MDALSIGQHYNHQHQHSNHGHFATQQLPSHRSRKRKAEAPPENNERLSKRLSLLNLEQSGQKLYVPVENPTAHTAERSEHGGSKKSKHKSIPEDGSQMQLDDTKYKVYIYNLEDELSSSDAESDADSSKLVFLPDIEKHLLNNRIPTRVLNPRPDPAAEMAGKELVLYSVPSSISVPEEQDSVRKAIIEARARAREKQRVEREQASVAPVSNPTPLATSPSPSGGMPAERTGWPGSEDDPDAMDID